MELKSLKITTYVFWNKCLTLELCPDFLKVKPPKNKFFQSMKELQKFIVTKALNQGWATSLVGGPDLLKKISSRATLKIKNSFAGRSIFEFLL